MENGWMEQSKDLEKNGLGKDNGLNNKVIQTDRQIRQTDR